MPLFQPPVTPLPAGVDLSGQTAIVTGATAGIGLEICRQLLTLKVANLIFAVRNVKKGQTVRASLLAEPAIKAANPNANVVVIRLDAEEYPSIWEFTKSFKSQFSDLHILMLNAGIATFAAEYVSNKHEKNLMVNYLANVLLTLELLPVLEASADKVGKPTRITWTGSRFYAQTSLAGNKAVIQGETVVKHLDIAKIPNYTRYGDSKMLVVLFQLELAKHYAPDKVITNNFCPGMIDTSMTDVLPVYLRKPAELVKKIRARSVDKAGWIALHAAIVAGPETHGKLLCDKTVEEPVAFIKSAEGQQIQKLLWNETVEEMSKLTTLPAWMTRTA